MAAADGIGRAGRRIASDHPFPAALSKRGIRIVDWAQEHGYTPEAVRSWYAAKPGQRRKIPATAAKKIERQFGLPADQTTWPQGVK